VPADGLATPGFFPASNQNDDVTAIAEHQNLLWAFGPSSVELYYTSGSGQSAFRQHDVPPPLTELGAPNSLVKADSTLWWLDGRRRCVRVEGLQPKVTSMPIEAQLAGFSAYTDCVTHHMDYQGHNLILWHFRDQGVTLVYDYVRNIWSEWARWDTTTGSWVAMPLTAYCYHPDWDMHFCGGDADGLVWELDPDTNQDKSAVRRCLWRGPYWDGGNMNRKFSRRAQFLIDGGVATSYTSTDEGYDPALTIRWRDEDRQWQNPQVLNTGQIGDHRTVIDYWWRHMFRRTQVELVYSANAPLKISGIELEIDLRRR
jgi:hypothetical protein